MNYYGFHVGDYRSATMHLTNEEDLAYRRVLDWYYDTEKPIPLETQWVARRLRIEVKDLETVLNDFFTRTDDGWVNERCAHEIEVYHQSAEKNRANGRKGGRPKKVNLPEKEAKQNPNETQENPVGFQSVANANPVQPTGKATRNQEPITNTTDKSVVDVSPQAASPTALGSRLSTDWELPHQWQEWAQAERPDLDVSLVADSFKDFWVAKPGKDGRKSDWLATWRNWVRNQRQKSPQSSHHNGFKTARQQLIEGGAAAIFDGATHV